MSIQWNNLKNYIYNKKKQLSEVCFNFFFRRFYGQVRGNFLWISAYKEQRFPIKKQMKKGACELSGFLALGRVVWFLSSRPGFLALGRVVSFHLSPDDISCHSSDQISLIHNKNDFPTTPFRGEELYLKKRFLKASLQNSIRLKKLKFLKIFLRETRNLASILPFRRLWYRALALAASITVYRREIVLSTSSSLALKLWLF